MLRPDLCDYSDTYIIEKGKINVGATTNTDIKQNNASF